MLFLAILILLNLFLSLGDHPCIYRGNLRWILHVLQQGISIFLLQMNLFYMVHERLIRLLFFYEIIHLKMLIQLYIFRCFCLVVVKNHMIYVALQLREQSKLLWFLGIFWQKVHSHLLILCWHLGDILKLISYMLL